MTTEENLDHIRRSIDAYGETSGLDLGLRTWSLNTLEDGRITRTEFFLDRDAAMRAAGFRD